MNDRSKQRFSIVAYAVVALLVIPVFPHFVSPNELTRWLLDASLVERGTVEVSSFAPLLGPRFEDLSTFDGKTFSNKAPGVALVALPGYLAGRAVAGAPSASSIRWVVFAMRLVASTIPLLLLAIVFIRSARSAGADERSITAAVAILLFATPLFAYGLLLFSHALTAFALFAAWSALFLKRSARYDVAAGALIGLAVLSEYPLALAGALLAVAAALPRDWRRLLRIAAGGLPFALLLGVYDTIAFGGTFELSSAHEKFNAFRGLASHGFFGIGLPSPLNALRLLLDPAKGLLVIAPVVVIGILSFARLPETIDRIGRIMLWLVPAVLLIFYAGYPNWHGGWGIGARYLVAILPFVIFPIAFVELRSGTAFLLGASLIGTTFPSLVFPFVPPEFPFAWASLAAPLLREGLVAPNLLHFLSRSLAIAVPLIVVAAAVLIAVRGALSRAAIAAGAVVWLVAGLLLAPHFPGAPRRDVERGYFEEVYFERSGAIAASVPAGMHVSPNMLIRAEREKRLPPTPWPF